MIDIDRRYRSTWDARTIAHVVGIGKTTVAKILREARGPRPTRARVPHVRRTHFTRRDVMYSSEYIDLGGRKLLKTLDEASGYKLGWDMAGEETAESLVSHARGIIERMGRKPLIWKFDHGAAGKSAVFKRFLAENGIVAYPTAPRAPWTNGRTERDNKEVRNWLIPMEGRLEGQELERDIDEGMLMLNYVKPRAVLEYRSSASTYFSMPGIEELDRRRFAAELVELKNQFGESRNSERVHRRAVRTLMQKWGLYEEWERSENVKRLGAGYVSN